MLMSKNRFHPRREAGRIHTNVGIVYVERGRPLTAEKHWLRAAWLDPGNTECREELATLYQRNGRNEEALEVCEQLRRLAPDNPVYHMAVGHLLARMHRYEAAISAVTQAVELAPDNASYRQILKQIREKQRHADE
jgi:Flp pilus assembly protein TadD